MLVVIPKENKAIYISQISDVSFVFCEYDRKIKLQYIVFSEDSKLFCAFISKPSKP